MSRLETCTRPQPPTHPFPRTALLEQLVFRHPLPSASGWPVAGCIGPTSGQILASPQSCAQDELPVQEPLALCSLSQPTCVWQLFTLGHRVYCGSKP